MSQPSVSVSTVELEAIKNNAVDALNPPIKFTGDIDDMREQAAISQKKYLESIIEDIEHLLTCQQE